MRRLSALAFALTALAACERTSDSSAGRSASVESGEKPHVKLYALECGRIDILDLAIFDVGGAYAGRQASFVDTCYLIRHPKGDLLWDAGMPDSLNAVEGGVTDGPFRVTVPKTLRSGLEEAGVAAADIDYLSVSHSHFDHVGNANDYAGATFIVQKAERAHMFRDEARADAQGFASYSALETANTLEIDGDHDVFGDGSVKIVSAPGHTPGHSVLLVNLKNSGPVLLTGDLYHLLEARERRTVPVFNTDEDMTRRSMEAFEALAAKTGARVVIQHSAEHFGAMPKAPAFLN